MDDIIDLISDSDDDSTAEKSANVENNLGDDGPSNNTRASDDSDSDSDISAPADPRIILKQKLQQQAKRCKDVRAYTRHDNDNDSGRDPPSPVDPRIPLKEKLQQRAKPYKDVRATCRTN